MNYRHDRNHYRIQYPRKERPRFVMGESRYEVIDLCETGFRYEPASGEPLPRVGQEIEGTLQFRTGEDVEVRGEVLRIQDGVAVHIQDGIIPFGIIIAEQQYLRLHYYI